MAAARGRAALRARRVIEMKRCTQHPLVAELLAAAAMLRHQANELIKTARDLEERAKAIPEDTNASGIRQVR